MLEKMLTGTDNSGLTKAPDAMLDDTRWNQLRSSKEMLNRELQ